MYNTIPIRVAVGLNDLILHNEAFLGLFAVENNIPISKVSPVFKFPQFLSKDPKALSSGLKLERTSANYKLKEGLVKYNHESFVTKLKSKHFSLNLDECRANNKQKMFSILVSFFDDSRRENIFAY